MRNLTNPTSTQDCKTKLQTFNVKVRDGVDGVDGAVEIHLKAGDALLFVDRISHGSAERVNAGERRNIVYRYGPSWGYFRRGYGVSPELLERLTPKRREIIMPHVPLPREPQRHD